jgi:putative tryptophan/tyrosine transport system substrate-binding protein
MMRRRDVITLLGGVAAFPVAARAQQRERMRRIGVLMNLAADDPEGQARLAAFLQGLQDAGWSVGRNVRIDQRWAAGLIELYQKYTEELLVPEPDVMLASGGGAALELRKRTRTVPIVFANATDPVGVGLVTSLARPGGNATGFTQFEFGIAVKWLELLKEVAPGLTRVGVIRDPTIAAGIGPFATIQAVAPMLGVNVRPIDTRDLGEMDRLVTTLADGAGGGLIVTQSAAAIVHRRQIVTLAARLQLPAIYAYPMFAADGGLIAYGPDTLDGFRRAAGYVDRILKGENPADLPVQAPTKYELVINLKTAKALGLTVPDTLLARADEVIE